jgi:hypothetical protein
MMLVEKGVLNLNVDQKDADNFNTDAYLVGQYQGSVKKNLPDLKTGGERPVVLKTASYFQPIACLQKQNGNTLLLLFKAMNYPRKMNSFLIAAFIHGMASVQEVNFTTRLKAACWLTLKNTVVTTWVLLAGQTIMLHSLLL